MRKLVWGMIGCGEVTEVKNGPGLYLNDNCMLKAVTNRTYKKAVSWCERHGAGTACETVDELIGDPEIDAVYIATTPDVRTELAVKCAAAGKHIYLDKPIAMRYADAVSIAEACERSGVQAYVAHYRRALPQFLKAKELITSGAIGAITGARICSVSRREELTGWRADPKKAGGGHFFEADIHALDVLDFLLGPYEDVKLDCTFFDNMPGVERSTAALFHWKNGVVGSGMWSFDTDVSKDSIDIFGEKGSISVSSESLTSPMYVTVDGVAEKFVFDMPAHIGMPHERLVAQAILNGKEDSNICSLKNAMRTFALACRVEGKI